MTHSRTPDLMPVLSRGKHRKPRKGACFMELASYLAGEQWSDHPNCTHPLLAALARDVNDHVSDAARQSLAPLIPEVIGLVGDDPRIHAWIARTAALEALPLAPAEQQNTIAVGVLRCERVLNELEGRPLGYLSAESDFALNSAPRARDWARSFAAVGEGRAENFHRRGGPAIVHSSVSGIARACAGNPDLILVNLLETTIERCRGWMRAETAPVGADDWSYVCELTGR